MINVDVSAKKIRYVKKISFRILLKKLFQQTLMKKKQPVKPNFLYFTCSFINYYCITDVFTLHLLTCSNIYDL